MHARLLAAALACAALAFPAAALGKGASEAKVEGKGLKGGAITFASDSGNGDPPPGSLLARLADGTGFFPSVFGQTPNPMEPSRPKGDLGLRYTISWVMPGPDGEHTIRQDIYPYAAGGPVTYTAPNQLLFEGMRTKGGWFRAYGDVKQLLVDAGLPATPPTGSPGSGFDISWPTTGIAVLLVGLLGTALVLTVRHRPGPLATR